MKRASEPQNPSKTARINEVDTPSKIEEKPSANEAEMGEFEDPYGDDFESEDEIFEAGENGDPEDMDDIEGTKNVSSPQDPASADQATSTRPRVYIPHRSVPLGPDERMEPDYSTYVMLHSFNVKWPSMSFDILPDGHGNDRRKFPHQMYLATGTQAAKPKDNDINVIKLSSLSKTLLNDDSDEDNSDEEEEATDVDPVLESRDIPTTSTTNRFRISPFAAKTQEYLGASMAENGDVYIWDLSGAYQSLVKAGTQWNKKPVHTIKNHGKSEGYAIDWSPLIQSGSLLTGDIDGKIYWTSRTPQGWSTNPTAFTNPVKDASIEDLQWSPAEKNVFASCGSDGFVRIWDTRQSNKPALSAKATSVDINVMSWNKKAGHLLATGHDDGAFAVWDLRTITKGSPVAQFDFHKQAITSIEWNPSDESVLALGSEDSTVSLWDLSVEADDEEVQEQHREAGGDLDGIPPQMLFLHWQPNVKEVHWHPQIPGALVSTGSDGFSVWKSISM